MSNNKSDVIKPAKSLAKVNAASGKPPLTKRPNSDMSLNTTHEEVSILSTQMGEMTEDLKCIRENLKSVLKKDEMEQFITQTISKIIEDLNQNMEMTIAIKVDEKTKDFKQKIGVLEEDNQSLRREIKALTSAIKKQDVKIEECDSRSKTAQSKSNQNEQYSRKNNVKIMDLKESGTESESDLISEVFTLFGKKGVTIDQSQIQAIHRIPGKVGHPKPVLIKFANNSQKTKVMVHRSAFKAMGNRLVDDVTKDNAELIKRLTEHPSITQAWYFNGYVYGKTINDKRYKLFEMHDKVEDVLKANKGH